MTGRRKACASNRDSNRRSRFGVHPESTLRPFIERPLLTAPQLPHFPSSPLFRLHSRTPVAGNLESKGRPSQSARARNLLSRSLGSAKRRASKRTSRPICAGSTGVANARLRSGPAQLVGERSRDLLAPTPCALEPRFAVRVEDYEGELGELEDRRYGARSPTPGLYLNLNSEVGRVRNGGA
jgi:hypothetical protein